MKKIAFVLASCVVSLVGCDEEEAARIGGDIVPSGLRCEEDEFIGYDPRVLGPRPLECVNYEVLEAP